MLTPGRGDQVVDSQVYDRTVARFKERKILLPTFAELARPETIPGTVKAALAGVKPDAPDPRNLFDVSLQKRPFPRRG